uniref:Uncharacterized protein n=1 Tax=Setaria italica TaxID=4555 RepID=K4A213_SETIT
MEPKMPPQLIRRRRCLASAIDPAIASKHAPPSASSNPSSSPLGWPPAQAEGSGGDTGGRRLLDWASSPAQDGPCGPGPPSSSPRAPAAGAGGSGGLSGGTPIFNQPSIVARFSHCSDEFSYYSGSSSSSSYSGALVRLCVSDSARRGRPVDPSTCSSSSPPSAASIRRWGIRFLNYLPAHDCRLFLLKFRIDGSACCFQMFAEATGALFHSGAEKKRKGVWIEVDNYEDKSERSNTVASEGSTVTAAASAGSTATSGRCCRPPRASGGRGWGDRGLLEEEPEEEFDREPEPEDQYREPEPPEGFEDGKSNLTL